MARKVKQIIYDAPFYSGTSGLVVPIKKSEYPPSLQGKSRLEYYSSVFNSIEINSIFYKFPRPATVAKWAADVPENFRFSFKLSKLVTHVAELNYSLTDLIQFFNVINQVGHKRGVVLIQFPPKLKIESLDRLQRLLSDIRQTDQENLWKIAIEFRNLGWYRGELYELMKFYNATLVIHDLPPAPTPADISTADFSYIRFHGPEKAYRGSYADAFLNCQALQIRDMLGEGKTVYSYFNNTMGNAFSNLKKLNELVSQAHG